MIRNLKTFGLAFAAVFAMSAVAASGASAVPFRAEEAHTTLLGSQTEALLFTTDIGSVTCKKAEFHGTTTTASQNTISITPTFKECTLHGLGIGVTVHMNGCSFNLETPSAVEAPTKYQGSTQIVCPTKPIEVTGFGCNITVPGGQTPSGVFDYHNTGAGSTRDIDMRATLTGITYNSHEFLCENTTHRKNGTLNGNTTVKGFNTAGIQKGIWIG